MLREQVHFPNAETGFVGGSTFGQPNWYAVHTMARHEKRIAGQLQEERVFAFLPLIGQLNRWSDRLCKVDVPLFSGYVFVRVLPTAENRLRVLQTSGVLGFVGSCGRGSAIADQEVENLRAAMRVKAPVEEHPFIRVGKRVRIRGGALDGIEGIIKGEGADRSLVLSIELLRRSVSLRVEGYDVESV